MSDSSVVYGATCVWWDLFHNAAVGPPPFNVPVCPKCGGVLYELPDLFAWWKQVGEYYKMLGVADGEDFIEWLQGKCFPTLEDARLAYDIREID